MYSWLLCVRYSDANSGQYIQIGHACLLNKSMEHNLSSNANSFSASQILRIFWIALRSTLVLSRLLLGLPSGLFLSEFPTKTTYASIPSLSYMCHMPLPYYYYYSRIHHRNRTWRGVETIKLTILQSLPVPFILSTVGPNISFSTLFSFTLSLSLELSVRPNYAVHTCLSHQLL